MTGFSIDWLDLREAADQRARDDSLLEQASYWLETTSASWTDPAVVDLGAGTGSTLRAFSKSSLFSQPPQSSHSSQFLRWRLVDQDEALLGEARRRHGSSQQLDTYQLDLTDIAALPLEGARLITASALFDLVSADFIDMLATTLQSRCQQPQAGVYAALNYDGTTHWTPAHPMDAAVLDAFNRDQQRDKGFGPALGPDAGAYMERQFNSLGFTVFSASSPWLLSGTDSELVQALINGIGDAVAADPALDPAALQGWIRFRTAQLLTGTCRVGHSDLLALPQDQTGQ